ncbi:MAG TPA: phenylalanine--tRNA ligase subunit beta [Solirubrobacteraceae bacterium]|jgi:phenylalanyl-tRNA synthetase beta chain
MRVPLPWLREYCDPPLDTTGVEERLTMTGTKVEAIHRVGPPAPDGFVVGRVLSAEQHPDADRLKVCTVDLGDGQPATIVCGASNVDGGQTVAVARPGAVMPDGTKLGRAKLRGVVSEGMILAASELELEPSGERSAGILVLDELDAEFAPGTPLSEVLPVATEVLELEITPNRPDCLGVYGVARELHAASGAALAPAPWAQDAGFPGELAAARVEVLSPDLCPRFTARVFEDVTIGPSPVWLRARLTAAGQRPINNVVDITNYAMLLSGQPLHAFDLDRVAGAHLTVRRARDGEQVQTLDGQTRELDGEMVLIEDEQGPTSIAGIMGGARSEVALDTSRVLLEVATWNGPNIHRTSWALGLRSEASARFEKGLQPEQTMHAQAIASALMVELCGATLLPGTIDVGGDGPPPQTIQLRERRVEAILGVPVAVSRQKEILTALDFAAEPTEDGLAVTAPPLRRDDVTREVDLIEEVARIDGLERLPATLPARRGAAGRLDHGQRVRRAAEDAMTGRGLHEIAGWSFADPGLLDRLRLPAGHPLRAVVTIENPLSEDLSIMRPTILGSLLDAARHNVSRGAQEIAIFESGTVYRAAPGGGPYGTGADEHHALGALLAGPLTPRSWRGERAEADFFAVKALLEALLARMHVDWSVAAAEPERWPFLHPGRSAAITARSAAADGEPFTLGFLGELHPLIAGAWDVPRSAAFAIDLGKLAAAAPETVGFKPFGAYPVLRQDLAVTLPDTVAAAQLLLSVRIAGGEALADAQIFDVYSGEQVGAGRRSLALALSFRSLQGTLTDEDVAPLRERIVAAIGDLGGELRG